ncbi:MAG: DUF4919 domain-containing protein [Fermentimonas sp.]|jgi:hypothetical protein
MKQTILLALFAVAFTAVEAQDDFFEAPNFKAIKRNVTEPSSPYFYPRLLQKYLTAETELNLEESRHLYFGYIYQPEYVPVDTSAYNGLLAETISNPSFSEANHDRVLQYADALLQEDPFNLRALNAKLLVYAQQDDGEMYKKVVRQRKAVQDAIISTGDGISDKTPFYVIKVAHEFDLLPFFGYTFGGEDRMMRNRKINYLTLSTNRFGIERLYFNISPVVDRVSSLGGSKF